MHASASVPRATRAAHRNARARCLLHCLTQAHIFPGFVHHQVGTSWREPRHSIENEKIISASAMAAAALENAIGCVLRRRLWRHLTCARVPNDLPACPVVIHRSSSPHSAFPRHVTRKLDSVRGRAEIASGWPAAPAGSSQQVSDLVPIIRPGLCTRGCPRDGVPRSCMHMPHRVLG